MDQEIFKKIKKETLTEEEKTEGLLVLENFIKTNPIEYVETKNRPIKSPYLSKSPYFNMFFMRQKMFVSAGIAVLFIFITGGTVFAANSSLPGDILYPVKIHLNEKVESLVAVGAKAQTEVKIKHTIERLKEAEELSDQNKLDENNAPEIEKNFSTRTKEVSQDVAKIKDSGDEKSAIELNAGLKQFLDKHQEIILKLGEKQEEKEQRNKSKEKSQGKN
ncbi:MAG TPA: DUF5667 domain-containing protein [Candidatus Paceibacterota bacterium]